MGPGAVLSHWSAAAIHAFDGTQIGRPELTVDAQSRRRLEAVTLHKTGPVPVRDVVTRRGVAVCSPARTIVDLASQLGPSRLGAIIDEGLVRRLWTIDEVAACLARQDRQRHGGPQLRRLIALRATELAADSLLEQRILRNLAPLRPFEVHHQVVIGGRVYVLDAAWPELRVAAEIDGRTYRTNSRTAFERETRKLNDLASANWLVAHLSAGMSAAACVATMRRMMAVRGASGAIVG
jgi:very-short-patch-repair endonuclease